MPSRPVAVLFATCCLVTVCVATGCPPPPEGTGAVCGDARTSGTEVCDDGADNGDAATATAHCNASCTAIVAAQVDGGPGCGDGHVDAEEVCDDGDANGNAPTARAHCNKTCTAQVLPIVPCGDGRIQGPEVCDDGRFNSDARNERAHCNASCTRVILAGRLALVRDINERRQAANVQDYTALGDTALFTASAASGMTLFAADTAAETAVAVRTFEAVQLGASGVLDGRLYFVAADGAGYELWRTDGTAAGTERVVHLCPGCDDATGAIAAFDGALYFVGVSSEDGPRQVFRFDGTLGVARLAVDRAAWNLVALPNALLLIGYDADTGNEAWTSDGTQAGTTLLSDFDIGTGSGNPRNFYVVDDRAFFFANGGYGYPYVTDGTTAGTIRLSDTITGGLTSNAPGLDFARVGDRVVFPASASFGGDEELFVTDGTPEGTRLLKEIAAGFDWSSPRILATDGTHAFFGASTVEHGRELWVTDGTEAGTFEVKDQAPGPASHSPGYGAFLGNKIYYSGYTEEGAGLYSSDGTEGGTGLAVDLRPNDPGDFGSYGQTTVGNRLLFVSSDATRDYAPYITDGTVNGTHLLVEIDTGASSGGMGSVYFDPDVPVQSLATATQLFFFGNDGATGAEPWVTDGTRAGTRRLADLAPGTLDGADYFYASPTIANGMFFFIGNDNVHGNEVFRSDGTPNGTFMVKDINPGAEGMAHGAQGWHFATVGNDAFFGADDGAHGVELWRSDGTDTGTTMVIDLNPDGDGLSSSNNALCAFDDGVLLSGYDGNTYGIYMVRPSGAELLTEGGTLYFKRQCARSVDAIAYDDRNGGFHVSDGTAAGTSTIPLPTLPAATDTQLDGVAAFADTFALFTSDPTAGSALWRSDGTPAGTELVTTIGTMNTLLVAGERIFFTASDDAHGYELWRTDLTAEGTQRVADLNPGPGDGCYGSMVAVGSKVYIQATNNDYGMDVGTGPELWVTDGTAAGTRLVDDLMAGPYGGSEPVAHIAAGLIVKGSDGFTGTEPWLLP